MKLWHAIPTTRLALMQEQLLGFLQHKNTDFNRQQIYYFDLKTITGQSALKEELIEQGLFDHIISAAVHVLPPGRQQIIHVDSQTVHKYSYNIPVMGCENTRVTYYKSSRPGSPIIDWAHSSVPNNDKMVTYAYYKPEYCEPISHFEMTDPTIICTAEPHNVQHPDNQLRIAFLCRIGLKADLTRFGLDNQL